MVTILKEISDKLEAAFTSAGYDAKYGFVSVSNRPDLCQYQCNGALAAAKQYKKAPIAIANEIVDKLKDDSDFETLCAVAPGFININLSDKAIASYVGRMSAAPKFGFEPANSGKTVVVDYGGPNVAKPLHVGHLRPAIIGESVKRIFKYDGFNAIGDVHLGDWGLQIGLIITELKRRKPDLPYFNPDFTGEYPTEPPFTIAELEEIYPFASSTSKTDEAYKEEAKENTALFQNGHRGYKAIWEHILTVSITDLKRNYDKLNVFFELWKKESDVQQYIPEIIDDLKARGIAKLDEGALVVDVKEDSDTKEMPPCIVVKSDGSTLYASTDIATIYERKLLFNPDKIVYVVDKRQGLHFDQVFRTVRKAQYIPDTTELFFLGNGTMNGPDGKPFKTRDGGVLRLEYLIKDIEDKVFERMSDRDMPESDIRKISQDVGLAAIKYGDLSNQATKDYIFDIDRFTSFEGNTGPYILYTMVRIKSILEKLLCKDASINSKAFEITADTPMTVSERKLMLGLTGFAEAIRHASDENAPHKVCSFIYEIADLFNSFYHENKVVTQENPILKDRWTELIKLVLAMLNDCVDLLGIRVPERM